MFQSGRHSGTQALTQGLCPSFPFPGSLSHSFCLQNLKGVFFSSTGIFTSERFSCDWHCVWLVGFFKISCLTWLYYATNILGCIRDVLNKKTYVHSWCILYVYMISFLIHVSLYFSTLKAYERLLSLQGWLKCHSNCRSGARSKGILKAVNKNSWQISCNDQALPLSGFQKQLGINKLHKCIQEHKSSRADVKEIVNCSIFKINN